jgi:hypothetical protein
MTRWIVLAGCTLLAGCGKSHGLVDGGRDAGGRDAAGRDTGPPCEPAAEVCNAVDDDCDGSVDEDPPADLCGPILTCGREGRCCEPAGDTVDLLLVVDNSSSMGEEQVSLVQQMPRLLQVLTSGDVNGDGAQDFTPVASIQVGVVTTDMGVGGFNVPSCNDEPSFGDDGVLQIDGNTDVAGCMASYDPFQALTRGEPVTPVAMDLQCVALDNRGCGFQQQLEAALKALTPSSSPITFAMGTVGHGDAANRGFVRPGSLLVVVVVTIEDDCSAADPDLFNPSSTRYSGDLNLRCFMYPEAIQPVSRYVDGLLALRADAPERLVYAAIAGVPPESVFDPETIDYDRILDHPMMQERVDPAMPTRLIPSCNVPGRGIAFPPRRLVSVAAGLQARGATTTIASVCQADFAPALNALIATLDPFLGRTCR